MIPRQDCRDRDHADRAERPFTALVLFQNIGLQILRPGDDPRFCMTDPELVDEKTVDRIQDRQNDEKLPKSRAEVTRVRPGFTVMTASQHRFRANAISYCFLAAGVLENESCVLESTSTDYPIF